MVWRFTINIWGCLHENGTGWIGFSGAESNLSGVVGGHHCDRGLCCRWGLEWEGDRTLKTVVVFVPFNQWIHIEVWELVGLVHSLVICGLTVWKCPCDGWRIWCLLLYLIRENLICEITICLQNMYELVQSGTQLKIILWSMESIWWACYICPAFWFMCNDNTCIIITGRSILRSSKIKYLRLHWFWEVFFLVGPMREALIGPRRVVLIGPSRQRHTL